jgi:glutathionylspermidine synthase
VLRFDFHWTETGWQISEVNSDVPGGFIEAGGFTALMARHGTDARPTGDPTESLIAAIQRLVGVDAAVGLVHATAYSDDRQVMCYLARRAAAAGLKPFLFSPADIVWRDGRAHGHTGKDWQPLDLVYRFFPAEWLPNLGWTKPWRNFFGGSITPVTNPATALLTQSKRFPLTWDQLETPLPYWRRLLPETRDPRQSRGAESDEWVLKPALGRVGAGIDLKGATSPAESLRIRRQASRWPAHWASQRRFAPRAWSTTGGPLFPVLGVYVIDGQVAGTYGRAAPRPLIDHEAFDIAVLVEPEGIFL